MFRAKVKDSKGNGKKPAPATANSQKKIARAEIIFLLSSQIEKRVTNIKT